MEHIMYTTKGRGEVSPHRDLGHGGDVAEPSVGARPTAMD